MKDGAFFLVGTVAAPRPPSAPPGAGPGATTRAMRSSSNCLPPSPSKGSYVNDTRAQPGSLRAESVQPQVSRAEPLFPNTARAQSSGSTYAERIRAVTLDEARAILRGKPGSIDELGPEYVERAYAAETIGNYYRENPHLLKPVPTTDAVRQTTTDAKPARRGPSRAFIDRLATAARASETKTRDATKRGPDWSRVLDAAQSGMGKRPGSGVGGELVMRLDGDVTGYYIGPGPDGSGAALYKHTENNAIEGVVSTTDFQRFADGNATRERTAMKAVAKTVSDFWDKQAAHG